MFGIGFGEMVLIGGIALIVIGPEKFPDFAKLVIRTVRDLRGYVDEVKGELAKELKPLKDEVNALSRIDPEKYIDSLTAEAPAPPRSGPSVHQEDKKILDAAETYGEEAGAGPIDASDPAASAGAGVPEGAAPAPKDTVPYGAAAAPEEAEDSGNQASADAPPEGEDDEFSQAPESTGGGTDGEPDVWTGR